MFFFKQIVCDTKCSKCDRVIPANAHHLLARSAKNGKWTYCYLCAVNKGFPNMEFKRYDYDSRRIMKIYWSTYNNLLPSLNRIRRTEQLP